MCGGRKGPSAKELADIEAQKHANDMELAAAQAAAQTAAAADMEARVAAASEAAQAAADAKIKQMETERENEKAAENAKMVAEQKAQADADAKRRANNRTLLAGVQAEEDGSQLQPEVDPNAEEEDPVTGKKVKKARKSKTLIGS